MSGKREVVMVPPWLRDACAAFFAVDWQDDEAWEAARAAWEAALDAHGWAGAPESAARLPAR